MNLHHFCVCLCVKSLITVLSRICLVGSAHRKHSHINRWAHHSTNHLNFKVPKCLWVQPTDSVTWLAERSTTSAAELFPFTVHAVTAGTHDCHVMWATNSCVSQSNESRLKVLSQGGEWRLTAGKDCRRPGSQSVSDRWETLGSYQPTQSPQSACQRYWWAGNLVNYH